MIFRRFTNRAGRDLVQHLGIFRPQLSLFEGVALIVSGTIGAGVLGIPYAVAQSGMAIGLIYIIGLGSLMIGLNLMLGEVAVRTKQAFQLSGLAGRYLGHYGQMLMTFIVYATLFGIQVVYIIGAGRTISALFDVSSFVGSVIFFGIGSFLIAVGLRTIKTVELFLMFGILAVVLFIAGWSAPHVNVDHWFTGNLAHALLPYGVILFAFKGSTAIPEVHNVLMNRDVLFKKAIILGGSIVMAVYALFAIVVVGVTGAETTQVATVGLGSALGHGMVVFGNVFSLLAISTSFLLIGVSLRDSLSWDYKVSSRFATLITCVVPITVFLAGLRDFIGLIDFVGGVFASIEMLLILLIYWKAKHIKDVSPSKYQLHHVALLGILLVIVFTIGTVYSIAKLF